MRDPVAEQAQADAYHARQLHHADFLRAHPEYSVAALLAADPNVNPVFAAAVTQSLDPRDNQRPGSGRLSPDQGSLGERLDDIDGSGRDDDENYLEQSPETGFFPHDA